MKGLAAFIDHPFINPGSFFGILMQIPLEKVFVMMFFTGLALFFAAFWVMGHAFSIDALKSFHTAGVYAAAVMFVFVGVIHFAKPKKLEAMIPDKLQRYKQLLNYGSGGAEIFLGVLLLFPAYRGWATWALIILLMLIFPANINVSRKQPTQYNKSRLFFQPVYILWLWFFSLYLQ